MLFLFVSYFLKDGGEGDEAEAVWILRHREENLEEDKEGRKVDRIKTGGARCGYEEGGERGGFDSDVVYGSCIVKITSLFSLPCLHVNFLAGGWVHSILRVNLWRDVWTVKIFAV